MRAFAEDTMIGSALVALGALGLAACSSPPPVFGDIRISGVLVGPPSSGLQWDLATEYPAHYDTDLDAALVAADPYAAASTVMTAYAAELGPVDAPDPVLEATLYVNDVASGTIPVTTDDNAETFFPTFADVAWEHVPLDAQLRIEITVTDLDPPEVEEICMADLVTADVLAARDAEEVTHVDVSMQCARQLLFVNLSVVEVE